jgi:uncharacterized membrane protein YphA (DoxX/SURF4 family)/thiol-disulfide isomerase/thioredoxin
LKKWLPNIFVAAVGALFLASGVLKLVSMEAFELYIFGFDLLSWDLATVFARLVIAAELTVGVACLTGMGYRFFRWAGLAMLTAFTLFLIPMAILHPDGNCQCFGESLDIKPLPSIVKNIVMALPFIFIRHLTAPGALDRLSAKLTVLISTAVAVDATTVVFAVSPPDFFFKAYDVPLNREAFARYMHETGGEVSEKAGGETEQTSAPDTVVVAGAQLTVAIPRNPEPELICFYSTFCHHCVNFARKLTGMCKKYDVPANRVRIVFMQMGDQAAMETEMRKFLTDAGLIEKDSPSPVTYPVLGAHKMLTITEGNIPVAVLVAEGEIKGTYNYTNFNKSVIEQLKR